MARIAKVRIGEYLKTALEIVCDNGGQIPARDILDAAEKRLKLNEYELARFEETG